MTRTWRGPSNIREIAQELRAQMTMAERVLWARLRRGALGVKFRRQHPIAGFIADFCAPSAGLVVEVDGGIHEQQKERDTDRDARLRQRGVCVLRLSNELVLEHTDEAIARIVVTLEERRRRTVGPCPKTLGQGGRAP